MSVLLICLDLLSTACSGCKYVSFGVGVLKLKLQESTANVRRGYFGARDPGH